MTRFLHLAALFLATAGIAAFDASAAPAQRTFVSGAFGVDSNPCSVTMPCRQFSVALANTQPGGEIVVLDSAGYGTVLINQAVTIVAPPGVYAGISVISPSLAGITINVGAADKVTLRGLTITGISGTLFAGIQFNSGAALYVENVAVSGFNTGGSGIVAGASNALLVVSDSSLRDNTSGLVTGNSVTALTLSVERTTFERNGTGANIRGNTTGEIRGSRVTDGSNGVFAGQAGFAATLHVNDCTISNNTASGVAATVSGTSGTAISVVSSQISGNGTGIAATNSGNTVYASDTTITRNTTGLAAASPATIVSGGDNRLTDNGANGSFSSTVPKN